MAVRDGHGVVVHQNGLDRPPLSSVPKAIIYVGRAIAVPADPLNTGVNRTLSFVGTLGHSWTLEHLGAESVADVSRETSVGQALG